MTTVLFLGTGGARFVVARQFRASGGMWMRFGNTQIHVDPGPGALVRALSHVPPCNPRDLSGIVLSHKHLDHSNDVNVMIEAMTSGGFRRSGVLLAPNDALHGEPVVFPYAQRFVDRVEIARERSGPYHIGEVEIHTSVKHVHAVETYGMHFRYDSRTVSYLPCGRYFEGLAEDYRSHAPDVLRVIAPRVAVLQHFGTKMLEQNPVRLARELEDDLGIRTIAAHDNMLLDVETEVAALAG